VRARLSRKRRAGHDFGRRAEALAALWLRLKFYKVLGRRYRVQGGEVDIIAQRGDTIVFVEVKARRAMDAAVIAITPKKQRRFSVAAARWISANPWAANYALRADAIFIAPRRLPRHVTSVMEMRIG
jgi:putative endonuclease